MADFIDISKELALCWLRDNKAVYAPIPAKLNRNKEDVPAKAIFVETENKFAPFLVCEHCDKVFSWYKLSCGKWTNLSGLSSVKLHQKTTCVKAKSASWSTVLLKQRIRTSKSANHFQRMRRSSGEILWSILSDHPTVSINAYAQMASDAANYAASVTHRCAMLYDFTMGRTFITSGKFFA